MIQVNLIKGKDLITKYWQGISIIILLIIVYFLFNRTQTLENKVQTSIQKAKEHEIKASFYKGIYDKLLEKDIALETKYDSLVIEKDKVKIKYNEKIKLVNKYSVSDWQRFYDERATKGSESSNP